MIPKIDFDYLFNENNNSLLLLEDNEIHNLIILSQLEILKNDLEESENSYYEEIMIIENLIQISEDFISKKSSSKRIFS